METEKERAIISILILNILVTVHKPAVGHALPTGRMDRRSVECETGDDVAEVSKVQYDRKKEDAILTYSANSEPACTATSLSGETVFTGRGLLQIQCEKCLFITNTTITIHMEMILDEYNISEEGVNVQLKWTHQTCGTIQYNAVLAINNSTSNFLCTDPRGKPIVVEPFQEQNKTTTEGSTSRACSETGTHMWLLSVAIATFARMVFLT